MIRTVGLGLVLCVVGCTHASAKEEAVTPPAREVWLTANQVGTFASEPVKTEPLESQVRTSGKIVFDEARVAHVFSAATGRVVKIDAQLGQKVKKNEALAVIRSPDVGAATSDLAKANADVAAAQRDYDRKKGLFEQHAAPQSDVDTAEDAYRKAQAETYRAKQKTDLLEVGSTDVTSSFVVRSPIDGEIINKTISPGIEVQGQYNGGTAPELFTVGDIASVWLTADVYELDLPLVNAGAKIRATTVAYPGRVFEGTVDWVSKTIDPATHAARMRCVLQNADRALVPEMTLSVDIAFGSEKSFVVPTAAVTRLADENVVFIDRGDTTTGPARHRYLATRVDVRTLADGRTRIIRGVSEGDKIVTKNAILLAGML